MRFTPEQFRNMRTAFEVVLDLRSPDEPAYPGWVDVEPLEATDLHLVAVRFPGYCALSFADEQALEEHRGEGGNGYAIGLYVVVFETGGKVAYVRHTGAGTIELDPKTGLAMVPAWLGAVADVG
jgi:hypothetical protein